MVQVISLELMSKITARYNDANAQNNISVGWTDDGSELVVYHAAAGGVSISNYESTGNGVARFDVADSASSALVEPVSLQEDSVFDSTASAKGIVSESKIALNFSNTFGYAESAGSADLTLKLNISLKLLMEQVISTWFTSTALDIQRLNKTDAAIKSLLRKSVRFWYLWDTKITSDEFEIDYNNGVLTITNTEGRDQL